MKKLTIILFFSVLTLTAYSQEHLNSPLSFKNKNSIQMELFGHGLFYSLNYERIILNGESLKTSGQVGLAYCTHSSLMFFSLVASKKKRTKRKTTSGIISTAFH